MQNIDLKNLTLAFPKPDGSTSTIYQDFSLTIEGGSFTVLLGPSGCGKSTFLNVISGLLQPTSADAIMIDGRDIRDDAELTRKSAYIFQNPRLLPWKTLRGNVEFGLRGLGVKPRDQWDELVRKYFGVVGLTEHMDFLPHQVSGGMQQRAAIVRAWANEPEILLMDEPFSHLDEITAGTLRRQLVTLWSSEAQRRTVVFVTHSLSEAAQLASDVVMLSRAPTTVTYRQTIDLPWPRDPKDKAVFDLETDLRRVFADKVGIVQ
jgi:NitT/TauT family transport system ATP-binding protein